MVSRAEDRLRISIEAAPDRSLACGARPVAIKPIAAASSSFVSEPIGHHDQIFRAVGLAAVADQRLLFKFATILPQRSISDRMSVLI